MRYNRLFSFLSVLLLIASCFMPWVVIESKNLMLSGVDTGATLFGRPAYFHFVWAVIYLLLIALNKVWAHRVAIVVAALNIAWAVRNILLLPACAGGECPTKKPGIYLMLLSSGLMFVTLLFFEKRRQPQPQVGKAI